LLLSLQGGSVVVEVNTDSTNIPLVSVIIPAYNYGHLIIETLRCLQNQKWQNWEAIIVDDGSEDDTRNIVEKICRADTRFLYVYKNNAGLAAARNTGLSYAKGDFIQFLDADDLISEMKLSLQVAFMIENPGCDVSYTDSRYFSDQNAGILFNSLNLNDHEWMPKVSGKDDVIIKNLILTNLMPVNSAIIRLKFISFHRIEFSVEMRFLEDWLFWIHCAFKGANFRFFSDDRALALVRVHASSMSKNRLQMHLYELKMRSQLKTLLDQVSWSARASLQKLNKRQMDLRYREILREGGLFNYRLAKSLFPQMKFVHFVKLKFKELNFYRKHFYNLKYMISLFKKNKRTAQQDFTADFLRMKAAEKSSVKRFQFDKADFHLCLNDKTATTGFDRHYIYHPAWAARILKATSPNKHIDISSTLHFSTILSAFIPTDFYDYRPAVLSLTDLNCKAGDLHKLPFKTASVESISCMHTIEHIGLGRYGDPIDYDGDIKAINELKRVLKPGGNLLIAVPLGSSDKICFNAHRIYSKKQILSLFDELPLKEFTLIPENEDDGGLVVDPDSKLLDKQTYGCGCFWFSK